MARNGSGTYSLPSGNPVVTGTSISSTTTNNTLSDIATALTGSLAADGQTPMTGNLNAGNNKLTAVAAAVALTDATTANDVQSGRLLYLTGTAGTNIVTASLSAFTTYAAGNLFSFIPANANTGATTLNLNSLGAKSIFRNGTALVGGELQASRPALVSYDGTQFHLINPSPFVSGTVLQTLVFTDAGTTTANAALTSVTLAAKSITPKSSNSTIVVECAFAASVLAGGAGVNTTGNFRLYNNTGAADIGVGEIIVGISSVAGANLQTQAASIVKATLANAGTTAIAFVLRGRYSVGATTVGASSQQWVISEIQN